MGTDRGARNAEEELRRCETRLHALVDESEDMILRIDADGLIAEINPAGVRLLGHESAGDVLGTPESALWSISDDHEIFLRLVREQGRVKDFEAILTARDGHTIIGLESATLIPPEGGGRPEIHATVKDISARVADAQALWRLNNELAEQSQKLKESQALLVHQEKLASIGQLSAGIAHEINNPLGFLKSNHSTLVRYVRSLEEFLRIVARERSPAIVQARETHHVDAILANLELILADCDDGLQRITSIVQHLRSFSRVDADEERRPVDINAGIEGALTVARSELRHVADVTLELSPLPPVVCVEGEIMQVFLNILLNASQAIASQHRPQKGHVTIRSGVVGDRAWVEIEDDGPGIAPDIQPLIFDPFFTTKPVGQGTGLGLGISRDIIVDKHGGSLTVRSSPGAGACFRIELPIAGR